MSNKLGVSPEVFTQIQESTAPGMSPELAEEVLDGHYSGKRDAARTHTTIEVQVSGDHGVFAGIALDLSRSGLLLQITDPQFASADEMQHLMSFTARVWHHFDGGFEIGFPGTGVSVAADVVRVTGYCARHKGLILIGCRFRAGLTADECKRLAIEHGDDHGPVA